MEKLLTVEQVAEALALSERQVYNLLRSKELPGVRLGRQWRVKQSALATWIEARAVPSTR